MHPSTSSPAPAVGRHRRAAGRHRDARPGRQRAITVLPLRRRGAVAAAITLTGVAGLVSAVTVGAAVAAAPRRTVAGPAAASPAPFPTPGVTAVAANHTDVAPRFGGTRAAVAARRTASPQPTPRWVDPMPAGTVTSCFGPRWGRQHAGVDLAAAAGTTVSAAGPGRVISAGSTYEGYGLSVLIEHAGAVTTHCAHLSAAAVQPGDTVAAGEPIGAEGSTGNSTGPHLHFEVREGGWENTVEPTAWMRQRGVDLGCAS